MAMPDLPPDAWSTVARAALAAEGYSPAAWARLSLVSRAWRDGLTGVQINFQPVCLANAPVHHQVAVVLLCLLGWTLPSPGWPFCDEPAWCYRSISAPQRATHANSSAQMGLTERDCLFRRLKDQHRHPNADGSHRAADLAVLDMRPAPEHNHER